MKRIYSAIVLLAVCGCDQRAGTGPASPAAAAEASAQEAAELANALHRASEAAKSAEDAHRAAADRLKELEDREAKKFAATPSDAYLESFADGLRKGGAIEASSKADAKLEAARREAIDADPDAKAARQEVEALRLKLVSAQDGVRSAEAAVAAAESARMAAAAAAAQAERDREAAKNAPRSDDVYGAWAMAKTFVEQKLKSPSSASFGFADQDARQLVKPMGNGRYKATGWVDAQNSFGATIRTRWLCELEHLGGDRWMEISTELQE